MLLDQTLLWIIAVLCAKSLNERQTAARCQNRGIMGAASFILLCMRVSRPASFGDICCRRDALVISCRNWRLECADMQKKPYRIRIEPWSAVRLVPHGKACARATALHDKRFLAREAPALPLKGCTLPSSCNCMYKHYVDRRSGPRRDEEVTGRRVARPSVERRSARGRRGSD